MVLHELFGYHGTFTQWSILLRSLSMRYGIAYDFRVRSYSVTH